MLCGITSNNSCQATAFYCKGSINFTSLREIIEHYWRCYAGDTTIHLCLEQATLELAVSEAVKSLNKSGKMHSHQCRVGHIKLVAFAGQLAAYLPQIRKAKNFDELHEIVKTAKIPNIGELTLYDTAHRIGCYLGYLPEKVYLHSGTRTGAVNLLGKLPRKTYLEVEELPAAFRTAGVPASDIENILCIYKKEFLLVKY